MIENNIIQFSLSNQFSIYEKFRQRCIGIGFKWIWRWNESVRWQRNEKDPEWRTWKLVKRVKRFTPNATLFFSFCSGSCLRESWDPRSWFQRATQKMLGNAITEPSWHNFLCVHQRFPAFCRFDGGDGELRPGTGCSLLDRVIYLQRPWVNYYLNAVCWRFIDVTLVKYFWFIF